MDALLWAKFCSVNRKFYSVNAKCGVAKIYGLRLGLTNSNLFLQTLEESERF